MPTVRTCSLLFGLCLILAGCGKCCESTKPASPSVSTSAESAVPPCCVAEPSRAALLSGGKNVKPADVVEKK
jgi:hypothetical protein